MNKLQDANTCDVAIYENLFNILLACTIFLITIAAAMTGKNDYPPHLEILPRISDMLHPLNYFCRNTEPLWHYLVKLLHWLFRVPLDYSGAIVSGLCNVALYEIIKKSFLKKYMYSSLLSFLLLIAGPLYIPWYNSRIYVGQGSPNVWHNPTLIMVKPFAVIIIYIVKSYIIEPFQDCIDPLKIKKNGITLILLMLFSAIAKPAFIQIFFPAVFIWCIFYLVHILLGQNKHFKKVFFSRSLFLFVCCLPTLAIFLIQFYLLFLTRTIEQPASTTIGIKLFYVMNIWAPNPFFSALLAITFPVSVVMFCVFSKRAISNMTKFSWLMYVIAFCEAALLYEPKRLSAGNFCWGLEIAIFIIWIDAFKIFFSIDFPKTRCIGIRTKLASLFYATSCLLLCFHVIFGIIYISRVIFLGDFF